MKKNRLFQLVGVLTLAILVGFAFTGNSSNNLADNSAKTEKSFDADNFTNHVSDFEKCGDGKTTENKTDKKKSDCKNSKTKSDCKTTKTSDCKTTKSKDCKTTKVKKEKEKTSCCGGGK